MSLGDQGGFGGLPRSKRQIDRELDEEIAFHLEMRATELERQGLPPAEALAEAQRRFGDRETTHRACAASDLRRERRSERRERLAELRQDLLQAWRLWAHRPGLTVLAALTLGIGIGAVTSIFSVVDHALLSPLPYRHPEEVITVWEVDEGGGPREVSPGVFLEWSAGTTAFSSFGFAEPSGVDFVTPDGAVSYRSWQVSEGFLEAVGAPLVRGAGFRPEDFLPNAAPVALVSERFWRERLGADPGAIGGTVELDGRPTTVLGVLATGVPHPEPKDLWMPRKARPSDPRDRDSSYLLAVGRLAAGVSVDEARQDFARLVATPRDVPVHPARLVPLVEHVHGPLRPALGLLAGAMLLVLLIACANVASLLLAQGLERQREIAVRMAMGVGRLRLVRLLLIESLLIALLGGAVGLGLTAAALAVTRASGAAELLRLETLAAGPATFGVAFATAVLAALAAGLAPALRAVSNRFAGVLRGMRPVGGGSGSGLQRALVVAEVALSLVLLIGTGLLLRSFAELLGHPLGFATASRAEVQTFLWDRNPTPQARLDRTEEILTAIRNLPGVEEVATTSALPFHPSQIDAQGIVVREDAPPAPGEEPRAFTLIASPGYFGLLDVPLLRGRDFSPLDDAGAPAVAVINRTLARRLFGDADPLGKRVTVGVMGPPHSREIVGVVGDIETTSISGSVRPELYVPHRQQGGGSVTFVVRGAGDAAALLPQLRRAVWSVDPGQAIYHEATLDDLVRSTLAARRLQLGILGAVSLVALALSAIGIYGLLSFLTGRRAGEIGLRLALGAGRAEVFGLVLRQTMGLAIPGIALGLALAALLSRFVRSMLFAVTATDPATYAQLALLMLAIAALAAWLPARRAGRVSPLEVLRSE